MHVQSLALPTPLVCLSTPGAHTVVRFEEALGDCFFRTLPSSRYLNSLCEYAPICSPPAFHAVTHAGREQQCVWAERATHSVDHGNGREMSVHLSVPSTHPSPWRHPSSSSPLCFSVGLLVAIGAVLFRSKIKSQAVYCDSELTVPRPLTSRCLFLPYFSDHEYFLFVSLASHIILLLVGVGKLVAALFFFVLLFLCTAAMKSKRSGSSVSL